MDDLAELMQRIRRDLRTLQESLNWASVRRDAADQHTPSGVTFAEITAFKSAIDDMRHFLWAYMEGISKGEHAVQTFRMQRATEMLRSLRHDMGESPVPSTPETRTFFDALNNIAAEIFDKHLKDKS